MDVQLTADGFVLLRWQSALILVDSEHVGPAPVADAQYRFQLDILQDVDYVLLSNFLAAARFAVKLADGQFGPRTKVLVTRPTIELTRHCLEEERDVSMNGTNAAMSPHAVQAQAALNFLDELVGKAQIVTFGEVLNAENLFQIQCCSSGFALGACNWILEKSDKKIALLGSSCFETSRFPEWIEDEPLAFSDAMVVSSVAAHGKQEWTKTTARFEGCIAQQSREKKCILLPQSLSSACFFDVLHATFRSLEATQLLHSTTVLLISPSMKRVYEYMNVSCEHFGPGYRDLTLSGSPPMFSTEPVYQARFIILDSIADARLITKLRDLDEACVILCGHQDLERGSIIPFAQLAASIRPSIMCLTDPLRQEVPLGLTLPSNMALFKCPLDPRANAFDLARLLQSAVPHRFLSPPLPNEYSLALSIASDVIPFDLSLERTTVDLSCDFYRVDITPELANNLATLNGRQLPNGYILKNVKVLWNMEGNELLPLHSIPDWYSAREAAGPARYFGDFTFQRFLDAIYPDIASKLPDNKNVIVEPNRISLPAYGCEILYSTTSQDIEVHFSGADSHFIRSLVEAALLRLAEWTIGLE